MEFIIEGETADLSPELKRKILVFLENVSQKASPELRTAIKKVKEAIGED